MDNPVQQHVIKQNRRSIKISRWAYLGSGVIIALALLLFLYGSTLGTATLSLEPNHVRPGESFTLTAEFNNVIAPINIWYKKLTITDSTGANMLVGSNELKNIGTDAQTLSGFTDEEGFIKFSKNENASLIQDLGCPLYLSNPTGPAKDHTSKLRFIVLPKTKPGEYTATVPKEMYCNTMPKSDVRLTLTVE